MFQRKTKLALPLRMNLRSILPQFKNLLLTLVLVAAPAVFAFSAAEQESTPLELTRIARPWEFLSAVGTRAGFFGNEAGNFEAWVYPL
ncbi:MAG: hypothetical protein DMG96_40365, partial [Acidobacteria bacterium]